MKKAGTLNPHLSRLIAAMGHTDQLVVCDSGLPIPRGAEVVDISLTRNIPRFIDTVRVILEELEVEGAIIADEMLNTETHAALLKLLKGLPLKVVPHEEFKNLTLGAGNISFVRTGEATPYANVILIAGVNFD
ncbi:MAG TPA: D-ribose pyranase [Bacteroidota bacterium]|nr:D-ribose pyranase [Bacteroidota bacterium]